MVEKQNELEAGLLKKAQNDTGECRITFVVLLSTLVAVGGSFCFGCAVGYSSVAQSGIVKDLGLSVAEYSMFGSIMTFGGIIGALFSGKVADVLGRRVVIIMGHQIIYRIYNTVLCYTHAETYKSQVQEHWFSLSPELQSMWFAQIFCICGWLAIAFAKDLLWLDTGRLSIGVGVGLFSYVIPVYIAEITPKHVRGAFVFANQLMQNCGISLFFIIGNFIPWRRLALISFIPCALQVVGLFFIPESPRWLGKCGQEKECRVALQRLRGHDADISQEASAIKESMDMFEQGPKSQIMDLFQRRYAPSLIIGVGLMLLQQLSGSTGITYYANSLFERGGFPSSVGSTILAMIMIPKALMGLILVEKMGRRPLLMASAVGMCLCGVVLSVSFSLRSLGLLNELTPIFTCIGVLGSITTFAMGMGGLPWIIMSEIFPMNVKVSAGTLVTLANWSFGWMIAYAFNFMLQWSESGTFMIFSGFCALAIAFVYVFVPETKGRTLEEIQASLADFLQ